MKTDSLFPSHQLTTLTAQSHLPETIPYLTAVDGHQSFLPKQPLNYTNRSIKIVNKTVLLLVREWEKTVTICLRATNESCRAWSASLLCLTPSTPGPQSSFISSRETPVSYSSPPNISTAESSGCSAVPNAS